LASTKHLGVSAWENMGTDVIELPTRQLLYQAANLSGISVVP
jgi:hypothetical protein